MINPYVKSMREQKLASSTINQKLSKIEHFLHKPVAFVILPIFALANTGIVIGSDAL